MNQKSKQQNTLSELRRFLGVAEHQMTLDNELAKNENFKNELEPKQYRLHTKKPNQEYNADCSTKKHPELQVVVGVWK